MQVQLTSSPEQIELLIADNGCGFDTTKHHGGMGLASMQERLREIGGTLMITSESQSGTRIIAVCPLQMPSASSQTGGTHASADHDTHRG